VHFVEPNEVDSDLLNVKNELRLLGIRCVYLDARCLVLGGRDICDAVAIAIGAEHAPYGGSGEWFKLLDDLITLSGELPGLVIVMDNADELLVANRSMLFDFHEAFLIQFHHWLEKGRPCHLYFQMAGNQFVREVFDPC